MREKYKVFETLTFEKHQKSFFEGREKIIENLKDKLTIDPFIGKSIYKNFFREKRFFIYNRRVYFLVFKKEKIVLLIAISNKKTQQKVIDKIKSNLNTYEKYIENLSNSFNS